MKICPKHKTRKRREPSGHLRCSLCNIEKSRQYLKENPGYPRKKYLQRIAATMVYRAKKRAADKRIKFSISTSDIQIPKYCPVLGIRLAIGRGSKKENSPTLDRVIPSLGYVKGNIVVISDLANRIKSNATVEQIEAVAKWLRSL